MRRPAIKLTSKLPCTCPPTGRCTIRVALMRPRPAAAYNVERFAHDLHDRHPKVAS